MNFKKLKKWVAVALGTVMMTAALAGCGGFGQLVDGVGLY